MAATPPRAALIYQQAGSDRAADVAGTMPARLAQVPPRPMGMTGGMVEGTSDLWHAGGAEAENGPQRAKKRSTTGG
jgi:hypothetical protein